MHKAILPEQMDFLKLKDDKSTILYVFVNARSEAEVARAKSDSSYLQGENRSMKRQIMMPKMFRRAKILLRFLIRFLYLFLAYRASAFQSKPALFQGVSTPGNVDATSKTYSTMTLKSNLQFEKISALVTSYQRRGQLDILLPPPPCRRSSALFSVSFPTDQNLDGANKKKSRLAKLRWFFLFPFRFLILYPIKMISEVAVDRLNDETQGTSEDMASMRTLSLVSESEFQSKPAVDKKNERSDYTDRKNRVNRSMTATIETTMIEDPKTPTTVQIETTSAGTIVQSKDVPSGERWAICAPNFDMSGKWKLIVDDKFKSDYDRYLAGLGQPLLVRRVAVNIVEQTTEEIVQSKNGRSLLIQGRNVRGVWDRTLVASGAEVGAENFTPLKIPVMTADSEKVEAEAWWENEGTTHVSWLYGVKKYGGGAFESRRYLEDDGQVYVCESTYHPENSSLKPNSIVWRFRRQLGSN